MLGISEGTSKSQLNVFQNEIERTSQQSLLSKSKIVMDNQDKLYKTIFKTLRKKATEKDFPSMEKVWGRVEEKLDKKALTKENNLWKKIAVAASVLLVITLGSQLWKLETEEVYCSAKNRSL